jgi:hypothetical protein
MTHAVDMHMSGYKQIHKHPCSCTSGTPRLVLPLDAIDGQCWLWDCTRHLSMVPTKRCSLSCLPSKGAIVLTTRTLLRQGKAFMTRWIGLLL